MATVQPRPVDIQRVRDPIKKRSSLRSLFSAFRFPKPAAEEQHASYPAAKRSFRSRAKDAGFHSTPSLSQPPASPDPAASSNIVLSTASLPLEAQIRPPFASHSPSSSSSSSSSLDFVSNASTSTSPNTSTPNILMKAAESTLELPREPAKVSKKSKRAAAEPHRKQPSPLSVVTDAQAPPGMPSPPPSAKASGNQTSFQPKRRNSLSRILLRRSQSNPDLGQAIEGLPPVPPIPATAPSSRPGSASRTASSSSSPARRSTLRKKSGGVRKLADLEKPTVYSPEEKMEHRSILFADPLGGYHLYPTSNQTTPRRSSAASRPTRPYSGAPSEDWRRNSWMSAESNTLPRNFREHRGRSFHGELNISSQVIPEESHESSDQHPRMAKRHSIAVDSRRWQSAAHPESVPTLRNHSRTPVLPSIDSRLGPEHMPARRRPSFTPLDTDAQPSQEAQPKPGVEQQKDRACEQVEDRVEELAEESAQLRQPAEKNAEEKVNEEAEKKAAEKLVEDAPGKVEDTALKSSQEPVLRQIPQGRSPESTPCGRRYGGQENLTAFTPTGLVMAKATPSVPVVQVDMVTV